MLYEVITDKKVPLMRRDHLVLLAKGSEVLWVVNVGVSETTKIQPNGQCFMIKFEETK